jgi:flagellin
LAEYIDKARDQTFNSVPLFSADAMNVTIDSEGSTFAMEGIDLSVLDSGISGDIETMASAQTALGDIKTAIGDLAQLRASLGAVQSRLNFTAEQLMVSKENLSAAISNISDTDVAQEATAFARYQILVESGTSMLAQANKMPQSALSLLRQ